MMKLIQNIKKGIYEKRRIKYVRLTRHFTACSQMADRRSKEFGETSWQAKEYRNEASLLCKEMDRAEHAFMKQFKR